MPAHHRQAHPMRKQERPPQYQRRCDPMNATLLQPR